MTMTMIQQRTRRRPSKAKTLIPLLGSHSTQRPRASLIQNRMTSQDNPSPLGLYDLFKCFCYILSTNKENIRNYADQGWLIAFPSLVCP